MWKFRLLYHCKCYYPTKIKFKIIWNHKLVELYLFVVIYLFIYTRLWFSFIFVQIKNVTLEVLNVIRETKNDDLTNTLQKIISVYQEDLADLAVEMCNHLVSSCKGWVLIRPVFGYSYLWTSLLEVFVYYDGLEKKNRIYKSIIVVINCTTPGIFDIWWEVLLSRWFLLLMLGVISQTKC